MRVNAFGHMLTGLVYNWAEAHAHIPTKRNINVLVNSNVYEEGHAIYVKRRVGHYVRDYNGANIFSPDDKTGLVVPVIDTNKRHLTVIGKPIYKEAAYVSYRKAALSNCPLHGPHKTCYNDESPEHATGYLLIFVIYWERQANFLYAKKAGHFHALTPEEAVLPSPTIQKDKITACRFTAPTTCFTPQRR